MKTQKLFSLILASLFLISFVSASSGYRVQHAYYEDETYVKTVYYNFDKDYRENEYRYPVSDYKYGYTYRTSKEYLEKKYSSYDEHEHKKHYKESTRKITYYEYVPYLERYEEKTCYNSAPSGKLFYIKCDF